MHQLRKPGALRSVALLACGVLLAACSGGDITGNQNNGNVNLNTNINTNQPVCGNGVIEGNEYCDGADFNGVTCADFGFGAGTLSCAALCTYDTSTCVPAGYCGDGIRQAPEECDMLELDAQTCESLGRNGGTLSCQVDCLFDLSQCDSCGDGVLDASEECDDGASNSDTAPDACRTDCRLPRCGDGVSDTGEACDSTAPGTTTCQSAGYDGGTVICDAQCEVSFAGCTTCGNNACEIGEAFQCASDCTLATISAAAEFSCAHKVDGTVWCWGYNGGYGLLGDGLTHQSCPVTGYPNMDCSLSPVPVSSLSGVTFQRSASYHSFAVLGDGTVWCWGDNDAGQLGNGISDNMEPVPVPVVNFTDAQKISTGGYHTCAVKTDASVWCWGGNDSGQLGLGNWTDHNTAQHVTSIQNVVDVDVGGEHTCAVRDDGAAFCWGEGYLGQLGDGTGQGSNTPVQVTGLPPVVSVAIGYQHSCALEPGGRVWCWGDDSDGQLGTGLTYSCPNSTGDCSLVPVRIDSLDGVARLAANDVATCALKWDGTLWCWGANWIGQLGDGTTTDRPEPVQVSNLTGVSSISLSYSGGCAVDTLNHGWCWGSNWIGQLGDGTQTDSLIPVAVVGL